jgi:ribonuclease P protein component
MIRRSHRFHGYNSLRYAYQHGRTVRGPLFSLRAVRNERRTSYRLAVVVSKKVSKSAVVRNRIRRRLFEAVRLLEPQLTTPYDLIITVFSDQLTTIPADEVNTAVHAQLKQAGVLQPAAKTA